MSRRANIEKAQSLSSRVGASLAILLSANKSTVSKTEMLALIRKLESAKEELERVLK